MESDTEMTPRCRRVLEHASRSIERFGHSQVTSGHLVLGLLALGEGVAANILFEAGVEAELVESFLASRSIRQIPDSMLEGVTLARTATLAFERAKNHADEHRHSYLGTEHLLLGILDEESGEARDLFGWLNIDPKTPKRTVEKELG